MEGPWSERCPMILRKSEQLLLRVRSRRFHQRSGAGRDRLRPTTAPKLTIE